MSDSVKLKVTKAGVEACLKADSNGLNMRLKTVKFSTDRFISVLNDERTALGNVVYEASIASGGTSVNDNTLRFFSVIDSPELLSVGSVGLFDEDGVLFAIASVAEGDLLKFLPKISFVLSFGLTISAFILEKIEVVIDQSGAIVMGLILEHEKHVNPHPQYNVGLLDHQEQLDIIADYVGELQNKIRELELAVGGTATANAFKFFSRDVGKAATPYPTIPGQVTNKYHVNKASVQIMPDGFIRQSLMVTIYGMDTDAHIILPVSILPQDILSVVGSPYNAEWTNDAGFRFMDTFSVVISGKRYYCIRVYSDRMSKNSPYNGWCDYSIEILGRHSNLANYNNMNVYPYSTFNV
ncbi:MAG: phage tail protein [Candidatus Acinetobacter avistercoris]|nr:phage tail protein [Candidatus Acinetobacter avistercoris]